MNLFIASVLNWESKGLKISQQTRYPEQGTATLKFECSNPVALQLQIRRPWWAEKGFKITVNGQEQKIESAPGSFTQVDRTWKNGDTVEVIMPMSLRMECFNDNSNRGALMYGPLVMAAVTEYGNAFSVIEAKDEHFLDTLKPVADKPHEFIGPGEVFRTSPLKKSEKPVTFRPLYSLFKEAYAVYWDMLSPSEFQKRAGVFKSEIDRQKVLESRTVDMVLCSLNKEPSLNGVFTLQTQLASWVPQEFKDAMESNHEVKESAKSRIELFFASMFQDITGGFRFLRAGAWFSYQMKVLSEKEQQLDVRIWTPPTTEIDIPRKPQGVLEVLVDGQLVGTSNLSQLPAGQFSVMTNPLPPELLKGKEKVEVTLRVPDNSSPVYGIYECRILKK